MPRHVDFEADDPPRLVFKRLGAFSLIHAGWQSCERSDTWISRDDPRILTPWGHSLVFSTLVNGATSSAQTRGFRG